MKKKIAYLTGCLFFSAHASFAALQTPSSVQLKIYEFLVSTSPLCTNPVSIYKVASPTYTEMTGGPTIATGTVADGTYPCLIMVFSDQIKYTATSTSGTCTAGQSYTKDICRDSYPNTNVDGTVTNCATDVDDKLTVYITTASLGTGNSQKPPTATTNDPDGATLGAPLIVAGAKSGTFVFGVANGLDDTKNLCSLENVTFSFR